MISFNIAEKCADKYKKFDGEERLQQKIQKLIKKDGVMLTFKENKILSLMMRHLLMLPISHRILSNLSCGMSNIRFALSIKYASSAAYQQVIKLGVLALPHSCPVLPTNVLDSSDSLTLSFQSWEDPGFLGYPRILPSYPSHTAAHAVKWIPSVQVVLGCAIC